MSISAGLFFIPFTLLIIFLSYKKLELYLGSDFAVSKYLRSFDITLRGLAFFIKETIFSFRVKLSLFILTKAVYPIHRISRRLRFRSSSWYFRFIDRLRERHMARYRNESSLYLRIMSSERVSGGEDKKRG